MTLEELRQALEETATPEGVDWVRETEAAVAADPTAVRARFPAVARKAGRGTLDPDADHDDVHAWTVDDAARVLILAAMGEAAEPELAELYRFGDAAERRGLLRALPFLPLGDRGRGLIDDAAYDQAVLKCVFIGVPIAPLDGLPARATPETARMLAAFVHERVA
ncbi:MAG: sugar phosphate isomerase/epimerase, partial [Solirubrobacteraceae bacterium]